MSCRHPFSAPSSEGFSLIELSIVLVILGLLVGGILAGQSLIRASELRGVSRNLDQYTTATHAFRDKYFALPGDMRNATSFWGSDANCLAGGQTAVGQTCNGNSDGQINSAQVPAGGYNYELFRFWQHLSNAGLIEGQYSGEPGSGPHDSVWGGPASNNMNIDGGINSPMTPISGVAVSAWFVPDNMSFRTGISANAFVVGLDSIEGALGWFLKPEEMWKIDTKMDDGMPGTGKMLARLDWLCTSTNTISAAYRLNEPDRKCLIFYKF